LVSDTVPISTASIQRRHFWLRAPGSLTARLRRHGDVEVCVLYEGPQALWPHERQSLGTANGWAREVVLRLNGQPAIWARSAIQHPARNGPWRALAALGGRPLAELLFQRGPVQRSALQTLRLPPGGPMDARLRRCWPGPAQPRWARQSIFWHKDHALHLIEAFAPAVLALPDLTPRRAVHRTSPHGFGAGSAPG